MTFDINLEFDNHINNICSKANSRLGMIRVTFDKFEKTGFLILYKSFVRPMLESLGEWEQMI